MIKSIFAKLLYVIVLVFTLKNFTSAGGASIWSINSRKDIAKGDAKGISIDYDGSITLAQKLNELFKSGQPFIWSSAIDGNGNLYLGTGSDGKIFKVDTNNGGKLFFDSAELNVSALAIAKDGSVYAGTSPDGKVYRILPNGDASVYFQPKEKYIWSLAIMRDGSLAVGTGENGKIYKVKSANEKPELALLFDTSETHIISLATDKSGNLYAGTDSDGLVLRFAPNGRPFALLDSPLREIHEIAVGNDGSIYALALSESASTKKPDAEKEAKKNRTVSVEKGIKAFASIPKKSRYDLSSAKSVVYRILPDGGNDIIWKSDEITAFSLHTRPNGGGVLIGTADKGRIYSVGNDGLIKLELQTDEEQVSTIRAFGKRFYATSSNQGKLFSFDGEMVTEGVFESPVLDAKSVASWGMLWWRGVGSVQIQTRSGNTAKPNETWSDWSSSYANQRGERVLSPKTKYLQWRAILRNSDRVSRLHEVNISFLTKNIAPEVLSIELLPSNVGLVKNPPVPVDANIKTLNLNPKDFGIVVPPPIPRKIFQKGAKSFMWKAEDRNGDKLKYSIYYRSVKRSKFKLLADGIYETFFTADSLLLADGRYVFKVVANDSDSNSASRALTGELMSKALDIDNTAPIVKAIGNQQISGDSVSITFEATENLSLVKRAEYSLDGGVWKEVFADDGISDSLTERFTVKLTLKSADEHSITLRVFDSSGNVGNARASIKR